MTSLFYLYLRLIETQNCEFTVILQQNKFTSTAFKNDYRPLDYIHSFGRHFCQNGIQIKLKKRCLKNMFRWRSTQLKLKCIWVKLHVWSMLISVLIFLIQKDFKFVIRASCCYASFQFAKCSS